MRRTEGEDQQRASTGDQRFDRHARALGLPAVGRGGTEPVEPGHLHRDPGHAEALDGGVCGACLGLTGIDAADRGDVDEREGGAPVLGDKAGVVGRGVGRYARVRNGGPDLGQRVPELSADAR